MLVRELCRDRVVAWRCWQRQRQLTCVATCRMRCSDVQASVASRHLQQLDQLEKTKDLLEKANARVEDLTVQLATKTELERYVGNFTTTKVVLF